MLSVASDGIFPEEKFADLFKEGKLGCAIKHNAFFAFIICYCYPDAFFVLLKFHSCCNHKYF